MNEAMVQSRRHVASWWRAPVVRLTLCAGVLLAVTDAMSSVRGRGPIAAVVFSNEAAFTYGLGLALLLGAMIARTERHMADVWHSAGHPTSGTFGQTLRTAAVFALVIRIALIVGLLAGGALHAATQPGTAFPATLDAVSQLRLAAGYVLASAVGVLIGWTVSTTTAALAWAVAATLPYTVIFGAMTNRAPALLDLLPYGPFGAVRAVLSGNGGLYGDDPTQVRLESPPVAFVVLSCWVLALSAPAVLRGRAILFRPFGLVAAVALSLVSAVVIGAVAPSALAGSVPWQWQPSWRHAHDTGWDSRQVAERWTAAVRNSSSALPELYFDTAAQRGVDPEVLHAVQAASAVAVVPQNQMQFPTATIITLTYTPPVRSGNVEVLHAQLQLRHVVVHGRWLITAVSGPYIDATVIS